MGSTQDEKLQKVKKEVERQKVPVSAAQNAAPKFLKKIYNLTMRVPVLRFGVKILVGMLTLPQVLGRLEATERKVNTMKQQLDRIDKVE